MKKIVINSIQLTNFKGAGSQTIDFNDHMQNIFGANAAGKTRLFNAFFWLLFGKDTEGRKDYEIKTTDENNVVIPKLDHEVGGVFNIDGGQITLRRILKEKWVKPRGAAEAVFSGNETEFYYNDVPLREKDYIERINALIPEDIFKLLTNPLFFNNGLTGYKIPDWQARRNVLIEIGGRIDPSDIAAGNPAFVDLLRQCQGKSLEDFGKELSARKKKVKDALDVMPARIDEATRAIPEAIDFDAVDRAILAKQQEIVGVDNALNDKATAERQNNESRLCIQKEISGHRQRHSAIEQEIRGAFAQSKNDREAAIKEHRGQGRIKDGQLTMAAAELKRLAGEIATRQLRQTALRSEWATVNEKQPDPQKQDCKCPSCGQDLPADKIAEKNTVYAKYAIDFNSNKLLRMEEIRAEGIRLAGEIQNFEDNAKGQKLTITTLEGEIAGLRKLIGDLEEDHAHAVASAEETIKDNIATHAGIVECGQKIAPLAESMKAYEAAPEDNSAYRARQQLTRELDDLKKQLHVRQQIAEQEKRVVQLEKESRELAQQLADVEKIEQVIADFTKVQISTLEERINGKFKYARFKLFDQQVNGQEVPCCETTYKGVVWGSLNTAAKVQVGLDIIATLSNHYGVSAPVFIDGRESITAIPEIDSQIINLIVSPADKQLRVA